MFDESTFVASNFWQCVWNQLAYKGWISLCQVCSFECFFPSMAKLMLKPLGRTFTMTRSFGASASLPVVEPPAASLWGSPWLVRNRDFVCRWECIGCISFHCPVTLLRLQKSSLPMSLCWSTVNGRISSRERCCLWMLEWRLTVCCVHDLGRSILSTAFFL